jgi:hypothetical protein
VVALDGNIVDVWSVVSMVVVDAWMGVTTSSVFFADETFRRIRTRDDQESFAIRKMAKNNTMKRKI